MHNWGYFPTKNPDLQIGAKLEDFQDIVLAVSYFRAQLPENYRHRWSVSLLSSEWNQVVPDRSNHQKNALKNRI